MNLKKNKLVFLFLIISWVLTIIILIFYFKHLIEKERIEMISLIEKEQGVEVLPDFDDVWQMRQEESDNSNGKISRYFLSEVKLIDGYYTPIVHSCLFDEQGKAMHPSYIYDTWSISIYPEKEPEIALIKYLLLPEDNDDFQLDESCYIKEIKTERDWQEIEKKYGF